MKVTTISAAFPCIIICPMSRWQRIFDIVLLFLIGSLLLSSSTALAEKTSERVRAFTRMIEFDFDTWGRQAMSLKLGQAALDAPRYMNEKQQIMLVKLMLEKQNELDELESEIEQIYADPSQANPAKAAATQLKQQAALQSQLDELAPIGEQILQGQVSAVLSELGFTLGGQPIPPVLYHVTPLPLALIVSPRSVIRQDANIMLEPDLTLAQITALEGQVEASGENSALVTEVGGLGMYPTMVMRTNNFPFVVETIAHEWIHNYLTLRPLGWNYDTSPELRTMNETTASIAGKEIGDAVLRKYYPEYAPALPEPAPAAEPSPNSNPTPTPEPQPAMFDFRAEMHTTRVTVDALLAEEKIEEAERYMESRRKVFWENGYQIRRLNQAYFAFHGAYADTPGGAAGEDPVGPAVRALRDQSPSLIAFVQKISRMNSFDQLTKAVSP